MLIARRVLNNVFGQNVLPGEPIPSPERWDRMALQSHINIGWIEEVPATESAASEELTRTNRSEDATVFSCDKCDRVFDTQRALKVHRARHK